MIVGIGGAILHIIPSVQIIIDRNVIYVMEEGYGYLQISNNGMTFIMVY